MPVISVLNRKGGVGKTSTCFHLAGTLARAGRRVLLVDNTGQTSLSYGFMGPAEVDRLDPGLTIVAVYQRLHPRPAQVVRASGVPGVDLVAGASHVNDFDEVHTDEADWQLQHALRDFLTAVRDCYDLILIDCPPTVQLCSRAALVASDG